MRGFDREANHSRRREAEASHSPTSGRRPPTRLRDLPAAWIHVDAHLDNVLWHPDGTAVLLDWSNAAIGPPAVDLVRFLIEGGSRREGREVMTEFLAVYTSELRRLGIADGCSSVTEQSLVDALLPALQGVIGWAGRVEEREPSPRMAALREHALRRACAWLDASGGPARGGGATRGDHPTST